MNPSRRPLLGLLLVIASLVLPLSAGVARAGGKVSVKQLAQARVDAAETVFATTHARLQAGTGTVAEVGEWSVRWLDAQRDQPLKGKALTAAVDDHLERMHELEDAAKKLFDAGTVSQLDVDIAAYYVAEAELWSARAHGK